MSGAAWCGTWGVLVSIVRSTMLGTKSHVVLFAQSDCWLVDYCLLSEPFMNSQERFGLEGNVGSFCLWTLCLLVLQAITYRLADSFAVHIALGAVVVDVWDAIRLCNQVVGILLGSHVDYLRFRQDVCIIFDGSLIGCVYLEKIICHF